MPIKLTTEMMAHCYDMLAATPIMGKWNLPPSEDIKFKLIKKTDRFAHHTVIGGVHHIAVSIKFVGTFQTLIATMAHEMIHVHQDQAGLPRNDGKGFQKIADRVCKELEFDRLIF